MADIINYNKLNPTAKAYYDKIAQFGKDHGFSEEDTALAELVAFSESDFGLRDHPGGADGLYQYQKGMWGDYTEKSWAYVKETQATLKGWGYDLSVLSKQRNDNDAQIPMFYAQMKQYKTEYETGNLKDKAKKYEALLNDPSIKSLNLTEADKKFLYYKVRHGASVGEIKTAFLNKYKPNVGATLEKIKEKIKKEVKGASSAQAITRRDPTIIDLDGDGIETKNIAEGVHFDYDGNGFAQKTGWVSSDDGTLVRDINGNGTIDNGKELFGDETILKNGQKASNGFQALSDLDDNKDGKIDANDAAWSQIKVWQDADGDGYSTADELKTLDEVGIKSINLTSTPSTSTDAEGNTQTRTGSFEKTDGTTGTIGEYNLQRDTAYTIANEWLDVPDDIAALPDLQGYGNVYDLQQAMTRDRQTANGEGLKGLIEQFIATTDVNTRNSIMDQILFKWTNSDTIDPTSRGTNIDARKLAVLEKFFGQAFVAQNSANPTYEASILLKEAYRGISEMMYSQLMAQTHLKDIYAKINYSWDDATQSVKADMSNVITDIQNLLTADSEAGKVMLGEFSRTIRGFGAQDMVKFLFLLMLLTVASIRYRSLKANPTKGVF